MQSARRSYPPIHVTQVPARDQSRIQNLTKSSFRSQNPILPGRGEGEVCIARGPDRSTTVFTRRRLGRVPFSQTFRAQGGLLEHRY